MQPTISNKIFAYLSSLGVDRVFLVPGGGNMFLVDAVGSETGIEFVPTHHEQAAVIAAEYYARRTGRLGVALVTTGPGSTNAITGISGAWLDSIPVLILAGQVKTADYNFDQDLRQKGPQEIDLVSMVKNVTKFAKTCFDADTVLDEVMNAVKAALGVARVRPFLRFRWMFNPGSTMPRSARHKMTGRRMILNSSRGSRPASAI